MKTALISVYDKKGIVEFGRELEKLGWNIISTGGTFQYLLDNNIKVKQILEITEFPEILDGRVKTLNPKIHGGILYRRDLEEDRKTIEDLGINSIDMVVNTLYPFEETLKNLDSTHQDILENIDIGGPSMIRAAAKNYKDVIIITDIEDYNNIIDELKNNGDLSIEYKKSLAGKAYNTTAQYDALIANYFNKINKVEYPNNLTLTYRINQKLRYGENPHQRGAYYNNILGESEEEFKTEQLHGKELSYNNLNDLYGAIKMVKEFSEPTAVAVKHNNPCGIGSGNNIYEAFNKAYKADEISIFGGIVALNRTVDYKTAELLSNIFLEIVLAPDFENNALELLKEKKNLRILKVFNLIDAKLPIFESRDTINGILLQDRDSILLENELIYPTKRKPTDKELEELLFAWKACKFMNSNGVVITKDKQTIGIGQGEVRRHWAVEKAIDRAIVDLEGSVMASDGFFFPDTIEELEKSGIKAIIQPGGSKRDEEVIELANKYNIAIVLTGIRHFKH